MREPAFGVSVRLTRLWRAAVRALLVAAIAILASFPNAFAKTRAAADVAAADAQLAASAELFSQGRLADAAARADAAERLYREAGSTPGQIDATLNRGAALQAMGRYFLASEAFGRATELAKSAGDGSRELSARNALAGVFTYSRQFTEAQAELDEASRLADASGDARARALVRLSRANLLAIRGEPGQAVPAYAEAGALARAAGDATLAAQAAVAAAAAATRVQGAKWSSADELNAQALAALARAPDSRTKANLLVTAGQTDARIAAEVPADKPRLQRRAHDAYRSAQQIAERAGDSATASHALGNLGQLYEADARHDEAMGLTRRAMLLAQSVGDRPSLYRWQWQIARLLRDGSGAGAGAGEDRLGASARAFRGAIDTLESIRTDASVGVLAGDGRRSFRETTGDLYFQYADVLFRRADAARGTPDERNLLAEARDAIELLKEAELDDYFQDRCASVLKSKSAPAAAVPGTAVLYMIPLPDRTEVLIETSGGLSRTTVPVPAARLEAEVEQFRRLLETRTTRRYMRHARQLYDWLIAPLDGAMREQGIHTLVFVPDGRLMTVPFAALHDGTDFLVARYAVAVSPGLRLIEPRPLPDGKLRVLTAALTEPRPGFPALDHAAAEASAVRRRFGSGGEALLNDSFRVSRLADDLASTPFTVLHLATHGQFERDVDRTFILTWDTGTRLTPDALRAMLLPYRFRDQPIELLALSACETAQDDDRAALGLAGLSIRCGSRSTFATLWAVNDQASADLADRFYAELTTSSAGGGGGGARPSKAEALRRAQLAVMRDPRFRHPCYWAPYLVIGNWL